MIKQFTRNHLLLIAGVLLLLSAFWFVRNLQYATEPRMAEQLSGDTYYWSVLFDNHDTVQPGTVAGEQTRLPRGPVLTPRGLP